MDMEAVERSVAADNQVENTEELKTASLERHIAPTSFSLLGDLQPELLDMVLDFLESPSPSRLRRHHRPDLTLTKSDNAISSKPFKDLSLAASWLRQSTFRRLFKHVCLDPNELPEFLDFVSRNGQGKHIKSVTAVMTNSCKLLLHPLWWARLLNAIPVQTFTIVAPPTVFAEFMAPTRVDQIERDSQAFEMPFHAMTFYQSELSAIQNTDLNQDHDIFSAREWKSLNINEGSFYLAYLQQPTLLQQEPYFMRGPPSLISHYFHPCPPVTALALARLESFTYIAIYPFFNHVDVVLKTIRKMTSLKHLIIQIRPVSGTDARGFDDEAILKSGPAEAININDANNEVNTAYTLIAHTARAMCVDGSLKLLQLTDTTFQQSPSTIGDIISDIIGANRMTPLGNGLWQRVETAEDEPHIEPT